MVPTPTRIARAGLLAAAVVCAAAVPVQAQTALRYKFQQGEKLAYVVEQKTDMTMNVLGNDVKMNMTQTLDMTWKVTAVKDGKAQMTQTIDRIYFVMDGLPTGKLEFDSKDPKEADDPASKAIAPILKALAGAEVTLTMDAQGQISDVKVPEKLSKALKDLPQGAAGLDNVFSEEGLKTMTTQSFPTFPKAEVTKGKSWDKKIEMTMGSLGKMKTDTKYTYDRPETRGGKKLEKFSIKPDLVFEADPDAQISMKLKSQSAKGTGYFDNEAGRLVETSMTQDMEMEVSLMGQTFTQQIKSTTTMKLADQAK